MTDKEINERVAALCGWTKNNDSQWWSRGEEMRCRCPRYTKHLDICHEFEVEIMLQSDMAPNIYVQTLAVLSGDNAAMPGILTIASNPRKRCEAFLRLKGQWE